MKIKLFTHTDLDGIGCAILAKLVFKNVDIEYCDYNNVNEKVGEFIQSGLFNKYNYIYITDISLNEQMADIIDNVVSPKCIRLIDHHPTALWMNKYKWAKVNEFITCDGGDKNSGTYEYHITLLKSFNFNKEFELLTYVSNFVESVRRYDTWEWKTKYNDIEAKMLNDLFQLKGRDRFIKYIIEQILNDGDISFTEDDLELLQQNQEKIDNYIDAKNESIIVKEINGYQAGVVFAERYSSELGNQLSELHPELDFIAIINPSFSISYRTIKDIDLGLIAKVYGGGGHPKASGSPINEDMRNKIIDLVFA